MLDCPQCVTWTARRAGRFSEQGINWTMAAVAMASWRPPVCWPSPSGFSKLHKYCHGPFWQGTPWAKLLRVRENSSRSPSPVNSVASGLCQPLSCLEPRPGAQSCMPVRSSTVCIIIATDKRKATAFSAEPVAGFSHLRRTAGWRKSPGISPLLPALMIQDRILEFSTWNLTYGRPQQVCCTKGNLKGSLYVNDSGLGSRDEVMLKAPPQCCDALFHESISFPSHPSPSGSECRYRLPFCTGEGVLQGSI